MAEEKEIQVKAAEGEVGARITIPAMGTVERKMYVADDDGIFHFPLDAKAHADWANTLFRDADKATATLRDRAALVEQRKNSTVKFEDLMAKLISGNAPDETAMKRMLAAALPELVKQVRADVMKELEGATAPAKGKNS